MIIRPKRNNWTVFKINDFKEHHQFPLNSFQDKKKQDLKKEENIFRKFQHQIETYCENTTLHGLRYVGNTSLTIGERIFWFMAFSCAIGFASYYISVIYQKWIRSPVIISFSPFDASLNTVPFPAITICNMNQAKKEEAEEVLKYGTRFEKKMLDDMCNNNNSFDDNDSDGPDWISVRNFILRVDQSCSDIMRYCEWRSNQVNCSDFFKNDLTDEGLCCSFNRLPPAYIFRNASEITLLNETYAEHVYDWNPENGFDEGIYYEDSWIPRRPSGAGTHLGLTVVLDAQLDHYYCSSTDSVGFKLVFSNSAETPKVADFGFLLAPGLESRVQIEPTIKEATKALRDISVDARQCYFSEERPLKYYRTYTYRNCKLECQSNHTLKMCDCIPYFLPKSTLIEVCGKEKEFCSNQAKADMELIFGNGTSCNCLPGCFELNYSESLSYTPLKTMLNVTKEYSTNMSLEYFVKNIALVHFYFHDSKFRKQIKGELYGFTEVLSNVGGLLGLCMGFSFLSFVEILYFVTIRVFCNFVKKRSKRRRNKDNLNNYPFLE